jgi:hypothetical protein
LVQFCCISCCILFSNDTSIGRYTRYGHGCTADSFHSFSDLFCALKIFATSAWIFSVA